MKASVKAGSAGDLSECRICHGVLNRRKKDKLQILWNYDVITPDMNITTRQNLIKDPVIMPFN